MEKVVLWFRRDLRIEDNPILDIGAKIVFPIFIFDKKLLFSLSKNDCRVSFIFHSLIKLKMKLQKSKLDLAIFYGEVEDIFKYLITLKFDSVICSGDYDSYSEERDKKISKLINLKIVHDNFLFPPNFILKDDDTPYKVFTSYYKKSILSVNHFANYTFGINSKLELYPFDYQNIKIVENGLIIKKEISLEAINFIDNLSKNKILSIAPNKLLDIFKTKIDSYESNRDILNIEGTSKIGIHLRFGTISIRDVFRKVLSCENNSCFIKELLWREFYNMLLYFYPQSEFNNFLDIEVEWENNLELFEKFKNGKNGVPIIDSAIIELNTTGYMHNRARMIVASFLTKNLHIDWRFGEQYFKENLIDYEASSNIGSWQWSASTGCDAQPYFRIFNPYLQSQKFDKDGLYIKKFLPQLENIESSKLYNEIFLLNNSIKDYPKPIVVHKISSQKSKTMFQNSKKTNSLLH